MVSNGLLQQFLVSHRVELQNLQQGNTCYYLCPREVEIFSRRSSPSSRSLNRPQEPWVFHDSQEAQLLSSLLVSISHLFQLHSLPLSWIVNREAQYSVTKV